MTCSDHKMLHPNPGSNLNPKPNAIVGSTARWLISSLAHRPDVLFNSVVILRK